MRIHSFVAILIVGLTLSSLAYRYLTNTAYYSNLAGFSDGRQRMTNQHAVIKYGDTVAAPRVNAQPLPEGSPPPPAVA